MKTAQNNCFWHGLCQAFLNWNSLICFSQIIYLGSHFGSFQLSHTSWIIGPYGIAGPAWNDNSNFQAQLKNHENSCAPPSSFSFSLLLFSGKGNSLQIDELVKINGCGCFAGQYKCSVTVQKREWQQLAKMENTARLRYLLLNDTFCIIDRNAFSTTSQPAVSTHLAMVAQSLQPSHALTLLLRHALQLSRSAAAAT